MKNKPFYIAVGLALVFGTIQFCSANYWLDIKYGRLDEIFEQYLQDKRDLSDQWMTLMTILTTVFAVFFVYSGFKIDGNVQKYTDILNEIRDQKNKWDQEHQFMQLLFKVNTWRMKSEFENALDLLDDILRKDFVEIDNDKKYGIYKEIADTNYQMGESLERNKENSVNYENAIKSLKKAMKLRPDLEDDITFLKTLESKYNEMSKLDFSEI